MMQAVTIHESRRVHDGFTKGYMVLELFAQFARTQPHLGQHNDNAQQYERATHTQASVAGLL